MIDIMSTMQRSEGEPRARGAGVGGDEIVTPSQGTLAVRAVPDRVPLVAAPAEDPPDLEALP
jgi:hypothetical protein